MSIENPEEAGESFKKAGDDPEYWVAANHGVNIFIFDWYWFDQGPFLESALNDGFLKASNSREMKFYLM